MKLSCLKNWKCRDKWARELESNTPSIVPPKILDDVLDSREDAADEYESNMRKASVIFSRRVAGMEPDQIVAKGDKIKQIDGVAIRL